MIFFINLFLKQPALYQGKHLPKLVNEYQLFSLFGLWAVTWPNFQNCCLTKCWQWLTGWPVLLYCIVHEFTQQLWSTNYWAQNQWVHQHSLVPGPRMELMSEWMNMCGWWHDSIMTFLTW